MNTAKEQDEISLKLLDEFAKDSEISQRALAARLGIALGLVNSYVKRLYKKGFIKITTLPRNRIKYIITPKGFSEKARLTYCYMDYSIKYFRDVRRKIEHTYAQMLSAEVSNILLCGDGEVAELCYISTRGLPLKIVGLVSDNKTDKGFFGHRIYGTDEIGHIDYDAILVSSIDAEQISSFRSFLPSDGKVFYL